MEDTFTTTEMLVRKNLLSRCYPNIDIFGYEKITCIDNKTYPNLFPLLRLEVVQHVINKFLQCWARITHN